MSVLLVLLGLLENYIVALPVYALLGWVLCRQYRKHDIEFGKGFVIGWQLLAVLLSAIFSLTSAGGVDDIYRFGTSMLDSDAINLIPFAGGGVMGMALNVLLFVPLGVALPLLWNSSRNCLKTVGAGFLLSLFIEISQLFNIRATDIDDLIMNTLGTLIGYILYALCLRRVSIFLAHDHAENHTCAAVGSLCMMAAVYALIAAPLLMWIWRAIYAY